MLSKYNRLIEVLEEGISAIDLYIENLNKFTNILEAKNQVSDCKKEVQYLKSQNQSIVLALYILRNIKRKKLELLKKKSYEQQKKESNRSLGKFINLKVNFTDYYNEGDHKFINIKINLAAYNKIKSADKHVKISINLD